METMNHDMFCEFIRYTPYDFNRASPGKYRVTVEIDDEPWGLEFDTLAQAYALRLSIPEEHSPEVYGPEGLVLPSPTTVNPNYWTKVQGSQSKTGI